MKPLQFAFDFLSGLVPDRPAAEAGVRAPAVPAPGLVKPRYELARHPRRRTLGIEIHPDLRVVVRAPARCPAFEIEWFVAERSAWIEAQLAYFRERPPPAAAPAPLDGAPHRYLGQSYRLTLAPQAPAGINLNGDRMIVGGPAAATALQVQRALDGWWRAQAEREFTALLDEWHAHPRFAHYPRPALSIRKMRTRWGSLGSRRGMSLNLALIHAPRPCIEYVVVHELCHLRYHGHGRGFYGLLESVMPDWRTRRQMLEADLR